MAAGRPERLARLRRAWIAALLAAAPLAVDAADIGTLFHTPEERERLDKMRRGEAEVFTNMPASGRREVTGFVRRSDGRGTVWINGVPVVVAAPGARELLDPSGVRLPGGDEVKLERSPEGRVKR